MFDKLVARAEIDAVFCLKKEDADAVPTDGWTASSGSETNPVYSGKVIITTLEANAPNGDNATFTASFEGVGALTKKAAA